MSNDFKSFAYQKYCQNLKFVRKLKKSSYKFYIEKIDFIQLSRKTIAMPPKIIRQHPHTTINCPWSEAFYRKSHVHGFICRLHPYIAAHIFCSIHFFHFNFLYYWDWHASVAHQRVSVCRCLCGSANFVAAKNKHTRISANSANTSTPASTTTTTRRHHLITYA